MPLRPVAKNPNAWDQKPYTTRLRKFDVARVKVAAAQAGITVSQLMRKATLEHVDRLGIPQPAYLDAYQTAHLHAVTAPQKAIEAQSKSRGNIEAFQETARYDRPNGPSRNVTRETFTDTHSGTGMKDTPPRL